MQHARREEGPARKYMLHLPTDVQRSWRKAALIRRTSSRISFLSSPDPAKICTPEGGDTNLDSALFAVRAPLAGFRVGFPFKHGLMEMK